MASSLHSPLTHPSECCLLGTSLVHVCHSSHKWDTYHLCARITLIVEGRRVMKLQSLSSPHPSSTEHTFTECPPSASWAGTSARSSRPRLVSLQVYAGDGSGRDVPLQERQHRNRPRNSKLSATHGLTAAEKSIPKLFWFLSNPLTHSLPNLTLKRHRSVFFPLSLMKGLMCSLGVWGLWDDGKHLRAIKLGLRIWGLLAELGLSLLHHWKQLLTMCL